MVVAAQVLADLTAGCVTLNPINIAGCVGAATGIYYGINKVALAARNLCECLCELAYQRCSGDYCDSLGNCDKVRQALNAARESLEAAWRNWRDSVYD